MPSKTAKRVFANWTASACLVVVALSSLPAVAQVGPWGREQAAATAAYRAGDYATAAARLLAAVGHAERRGPRDPRRAATLNDLGLTYFRQGRYAEAEPLHVRALEIRRKVLGPLHPLVAQSLETYAELLLRTGRATEAKRLQILAASIRARNAEVNRLKPARPQDPKRRAVHLLKIQD